jgi:hypothetical protein
MGFPRFIKYGSDILGMDGSIATFRYDWPDDPTMFFRFEENIIDSAGNFIGDSSGTSYIDGKVGYGIDLSTNNSLFITNMSTEYFKYPKVFSLSIWVKLNNYTPEVGFSCPILTDGSINLEPYYTNNFSIWVLEQNLVAYRSTGSPTNIVTATDSSILIGDRDWHLICSGFDGTNLWIDVDSGKASGSGAITGSGFGNAGQLKLNGKTYFGSELRNYQLYADQLRYYEDYTLSVDDIKILWNGGAGR